MNRDGTDLSTRKRPASVVAGVLAAGMILMGAYGAVRGMHWSLSLLLVALGATVLIGIGRPLYRMAVYRTSQQEIVCRFIPWYQAVSVATSVMFPIVGIAAIAQGSEPDSPPWVRYAGYIALIMGIVFAASALLAWFFNRLTLTPSHLDVRIVFRPPRHIPREDVREVISKSLKNGATGADRLHVDLEYSTAEAGQPNGTATIGILDTQFTVDPANLLAALQSWKDGDPNDSKLIERVETILRGVAES